MYGGLDVRCKIDRVFGISRETGNAWMTAAREGDLATINSIISSIVSDETKDEGESAHQHSPLWRLLHYNGQGTSYGFIGSSALHWAAANGDVDMTKMLLKLGAAVNCQNHGLSTPLHSACANGQPATVQLLLMAGASTSVVDCCGDRPIDVIPPSDKIANQVAHDMKVLLSGAQMLHSKLINGVITTESFSAVELRSIASSLGIGVLLERQEMVQACNKALSELALGDVIHRATQSGAEAMSFLTGVTERRLAILMRQHKETKSDEETDENKRIEEKSNELRVKGNAKFAEGNLKEAIRYYTIAINMNPMNGVVYNNRAACYLRLRMYKCALNDAKAAITISPEWVKAYHRYGCALQGLGRYAQAQAAFEKGLSLPSITADEIRILKETYESIRNLPLSKDSSTVVNNDHSSVSSTSSSDTERSDEKEIQEVLSTLPYVPLADRKPWFDCPLCENRTRDRHDTDCCRKAACGTCIKKAKQQCPFRCFNNLRSSKA